MNRLIIFIGCLLGACVALATDEGGYRLVWEDNFDGSELDDKNWTIETFGDGAGNHELQFYREENVSVGREPVTGESCLVITARREQYRDRQFTSGRIISRDKFTFQYGKIEARIRLPRTADGLWPAFWLMGNDITEVGWPRCGEIDILEMGHANGIKQGLQSRFFNGACHWAAGWKEAPHAYCAQDHTADYDLQDGFHLYTLVWDEDSLRMYCDLDRNPQAAPYFTLDISDQSDDKAPGYYFHKPVFVLFNLAVGGDFPAIWDADGITALNEQNDYEACMYVDYVRVYQLPATSYQLQVPCGYSSGNLGAHDL